MSFWPHDTRGKCYRLYEISEYHSRLATVTQFPNLALDHIHIIERFVANHSVQTAYHCPIRQQISKHVPQMAGELPQPLTRADLLF